MSDDSIGALWTKTGRKEDFLSGLITINGEKIGIVVFKNNFKQTDKQPDWKIYKAREKETTQTPPPAANEQEDIPF